MAPRGPLPPAPKPVVVGNVPLPRSLFPAARVFSGTPQPWGVSRVVGTVPPAAPPPPYSPPPCNADGGDADGDGHKRIACGGDDCDDTDASRYPGNVEVCDPSNHDEDCDPSTYGHRDDDGDGEVSWNCCNVASDSRAYCGLDCDDSNAAIRFGVQRCLDAKTADVCGWGSVGCPSGTTKCVSQANGTGVCIP
ncbi:MAG TPA: hypothetical protein VMI75_29235 [Polyangiaceae bacterium]|nr:hypothetical protein [Polyangiaceae bacterium]